MRLANIIKERRMKVQEIIDNILINENAYFYENRDNINLSNNKITEIFKIVSSIKTGRYLLNSIRQKLNQQENIYYSTYSGDIVPPIPEDMVPLFHDVNRVKLVKNLSF